MLFFSGSSFLETQAKKPLCCVKKVTLVSNRVKFMHKLLFSFFFEIFSYNDTCPLLAIYYVPGTLQTYQI